MDDQERQPDCLLRQGLVPRLAIYASAAFGVRRANSGYCRLVRRETLNLDFNCVGYVASRGSISTAMQGVQETVLCPDLHV
jgi:hypothetical protein